MIYRPIDLLRMAHRSRIDGWPISDDLWRQISVFMLRSALCYRFSRF